MRQGRINDPSGAFLTYSREKCRLVDQLKRALCSALLNLVEGNHRRSAKERGRFFEISRASLSEVAATSASFLRASLASLKTNTRRAAIVDMAHLLGFISNQDDLKSELPDRTLPPMDSCGDQAHI